MIKTCQVLFCSPKSQLKIRVILYSPPLYKRAGLCYNMGKNV